MTASQKPFFLRLLNKWWLPAFINLSALLAAALSSVSPWNPGAGLLTAIIIVLGGTFLWIIIITSWSFVRQRWVGGIIHLLTLIVCVSAAVAVFKYVLFNSISLENDRDFGRNIVIPTDMKFELPLDSLPLNFTEADSEGQALINSFSNSIDADTGKLNVDLQVLNEFAGRRKNLLMRHLTTSAKWFVSADRGRIYAYRRFIINGQWQNCLNGYYSSGTFNKRSDSGFQFRILISPDKPVISKPFQNDATTAKVSDRFVQLKTITDNQFGSGIESYLVLKSRRAALEIFEQSRCVNRPFTRMVLDQINRELISVLLSRNAYRRGFDTLLMPSVSVTTGLPEIHLVNGMQGGVYSVYAFMNPGKPGYTYLKVFEATKNTPLSEDKIKQRSIEYTGWSKIPNERFFYNCEITVYEGSVGVYYPARFELWFVPGSGEPEKKLMEKIFRIEGWQR